jgi:hypothetical protein
MRRPTPLPLPRLPVRERLATAAELHAAWEALRRTGALTLHPPKPDPRRPLRATPDAR